MKRVIILAIIAIVFGLLGTLASCTTSKGGTGCAATRGKVGY